MILLLIFVWKIVLCQDDFSPFVTASCKSGFMNIKVKFPSQFYGAVHVRDYRKNECMTVGNGDNFVNLNVNIFANEHEKKYCGVIVTKNSERSIQLAVRVHRSLELAEDKFFIITCGKTGQFKNENANLNFITTDDNLILKETTYGQTYYIKAELKNITEGSRIIVRNCIAFDKNNNKIPLINEFGCPYNADIITSFISDFKGTSATSVLKSMFKFPESSEVNLQCDIGQCDQSQCLNENTCNKISLAGFSNVDLNSSIANISKQLATTTVFVLDPSDNKLAACQHSGIRPHWILWLTITLGILFIIMLLMNIFLCTAMNCSWARSEIIEKDPSIVEEYDPYRSWHGSQYGSRYSLHGRDSHNKGYLSGGSTIHSSKSERY